MYEYFMRPEPRDHLGPICYEYDEKFGRKVPVRSAIIGMVRNASEGNRKTVKVFLEPFPHIRIPQAKPLQGWYKGANERNSVRPRPCYTEALLTEPYGGYCPVGCVHCYINSGMRGYRGTGLITVPEDYGEQVRKQLRSIRRGSAGYITSFHDPFNPLEKIYHNAEETGKAFIEVGLPIFYLSRLIYPDWAIEQLKQNPYSYAQKSMNTSCEEDWKRMSPGAASLEEHYKDIQKLNNAGVYVSIQVNPIVLGVTDPQEIISLFKSLADAGANHVIVKFIECAYSWAPTVVNRMKKLFGDRGKKFESLFTCNIGSERTIDEAERVRLHKLFRSKATEYGLTYSLCYEYGYERDAQGNILNKTGISLGPQFTTSAQCHGQRVPCYYRRSAEEKFQQVRQCPSSGCLYCAEQNNGKPRCGDVIWGEAWALRMKDLRKSPNLK